MSQVHVTQTPTATCLPDDFPENSQEINSTNTSVTVNKCSGSRRSHKSYQVYDNPEIYSSFSIQSCCSRAPENPPEIPYSSRIPHSTTLKLLPQQVSLPVPGSGTKHVRDNQPDTSKIAEICGRAMFHQDRDAILGKTFLSISEINNRFHKVSQIQIQIQNL